MWQKIKDHPRVATTIAALLFIGTVWPVLSHDTLPEFIGKRIPAVILPPWYYLTLLAAGLAVVVLQAVLILNRHADAVDDPIKVRATQTGYYGDIRRRENDVFTIKSEQEFSSTWMERVPLDTPEQHTTSAQALRQIEAGLRGKNPDEADEMRINDLQRALSSVSSERDALQGALEQTQSERETLRGQLGTTTATLVEYMAEVACCKLERLSRKYLPEKSNATVTVRFIEYPDGPLADRIVDLFARYTQWARKRIRDDGSDIRQPLGMSRVMVESGTPELARDLMMIFNEGNLLKEPVSGREIHDRDDYDVIVTIFPLSSSAPRA